MCRRKLYFQALIKRLIPQTPHPHPHPNPPFLILTGRRRGCRHRLTPRQGAGLIDEIIVLISDLYLFGPRVQSDECRSGC